LSPIDIRELSSGFPQVLQRILWGTHAMEANVYAPLRQYMLQNANPCGFQPASATRLQQTAWNKTTAAGNGPSNDHAIWQQTAN